MKMKAALRGGPHLTAGWVKDARRRIAATQPSRKCSQSAFAKLLRPPVETDTIAKLEQGRLRLTPQMAHRIAKLLQQRKAPESMPVPVPPSPTP